MMSLEDFEDIYGYNRGSVYSAHSSGKGGILKFYDPDTSMIDDLAFVKAIEAVKMSRINAQTLYYPMIDLFGCANKMAKIMSKVTDRTVQTWNTWFSNGLFVLPTDREVKLEVPKMVEEFLWVALCLFTIAVKRGKLDASDWIY